MSPVRGALRTIGAAAVIACAASSAAGNPIASVTPLWSFNHATAQPGQARDSEIPVWHGASRTLWVVGGDGLDVLDLAGNLVQSINLGSFGIVNSVALNGNIAALSFTSPGITTPGTVQFFDVAAFLGGAGAGAALGSVNVGAVPDMVTWTPDGTRLLVANEGERQSNTNNPPGSVSVIQFNVAAPSSSTVTTAGFQAFDGQEDALRTTGVRIQAGVSASIAFEPEYIAIAPDGLRAMVVLQENNALAELDLQTNQITRILPLGAKDYSLADSGFRLADGTVLSNAIDPSNQDGTISFRNVPVVGLYMPDAISSYSAGGQTYYVMANEGDAFVDDSDIIRFGNAAVTLDPTVFNGVDLPSEAELKPDSVLGRLNIVRDGRDGSASIDNMTEIVSLGGRSFSIRDADGNLVFDSGNLLDVEAAARGLYMDSRSDDKGVEPEGVEIFQIGGRTLAFIGLERTSTSAVAMFDITDPNAVSFLDFIVGLPGDQRAEGLAAFEVDGLYYLAVSNEAPSTRTTLFLLTPVPEPGTWALMAAGMLMLGALARRRRQG
jgi:hypothetical protein